MPTINNLSDAVKGVLSAFSSNKIDAEPKKQIEIEKKTVVKQGGIKRKKRAKSNVLKRTENLPKYKEVIGGKDHIISVPEDKLLTYTALRQSSETDLVYILCSEVTLDLAVDNIFCCH